jgi:hypothetical protein
MRSWKLLLVLCLMLVVPLYGYAAAGHAAGTVRHAPHQTSTHCCDLGAAPCDQPCHDSSCGDCQDCSTCCHALSSSSVAGPGLELPAVCATASPFLMPALRFGVDPRWRPPRTV